MNVPLEKSMRIISDLVAYCSRAGADEFQISLSQQDGYAYMTISAPIAHLTPETLQELSDGLKVPRQHEVEQNYWELTGESAMATELTLIGMMIDRSKVGYRNGVLHIHAWRKE